MAKTDDGSIIYLLCTTKITAVKKIDAVMPRLQFYRIVEALRNFCFTCECTLEPSPINCLTSAMEFLHDDGQLGDVALPLSYNNKAPMCSDPDRDFTGPRRPSETIFGAFGFQDEESDNLMTDMYKLHHFNPVTGSVGPAFGHIGSALSDTFSLLKSDTLSQCTDSVEMSYGSSEGQAQSRTSSANEDDLSSFLILHQSLDTNLTSSAEPGSSAAVSMLLQNQSRCSLDSFENVEPNSSRSDSPDGSGQQNASSESATNDSASTANTDTGSAQPLGLNPAHITSTDAALLQAPVRGADGMYSCAFCSMRFKQTGNRKKHIEETHMRRKPFSCSVCHVSFSRKHARDTHQKAVHEQLRPYSCPFCFKLYKNRSDLNKHIRTVEKQEKPFSCVTCGRSFGERGKLRRHTAIHTKSNRLQAQA